MKLYITGPMSGLPDSNYPTFNRTAEQLQGHGYQVENPADNEDGLRRALGQREPVYTDYLRAGLAQLLRCDGVAVLEDWWLSGGARWEVQTAGILRVPVRPVGEWLNLASVDPRAVFAAARSRRSERFAEADTEYCDANCGAINKHGQRCHSVNCWAERVRRMADR